MNQEKFKSIVQIAIDREIEAAEEEKHRDMLREFIAAGGETQTYA